MREEKSEVRSSIIATVTLRIEFAGSLYHIT